MTSSADVTHLVYNARIWQSHDAADVTSELTWMTFNEETGHITSVGRSAPPVDSISPARQHDMSGQRIIPGLHESHIHIATVGRILRSVDLTGCQSIEQLQDRVAKFASRYPDASWIIGCGWEHQLLGRYPTRHDLDAVCSDRPVHLARVCSHVSVDNTRALSLAGGRIVRDADGHPTGLLIEDAQKPVTRLLPASVDEVAELISDALQLVLRHGVTAVHTCEDGTWLSFCQLARQGRLPLRVFYSAYFNADRLDKPSFPAAGTTEGSLLSCDRVKMFADGAMGADTAALSLPYCNGSSSDNHGMLLLTQDEMTSRVAMATSLGYRVEIHVIGDRAVDLALNALDEARVAPEKRPIFIHCQVLRADQLDRMRRLGVVASIQPQFVTTDARWIASKLPQQLMALAYPWKSLLDAGIVCAGGSDAPVETPQPLLGIYDAIYRPVGNRCHNDEQFKVEECLSVGQAIDLYTSGAAYATMQEHRLGQLLPGFQADFVVLDKDACRCPGDLLTVGVLEVWVAGRRRL